MKKAKIMYFNLPWRISLNSSRYFLDIENYMLLKVCIQRSKHKTSLKTCIQYGILELFPRLSEVTTFGSHLKEAPLVTH